MALHLFIEGGKIAATEVPAISEVYPGHCMNKLEIGDGDSCLGANSTEFL